MILDILIALFFVSSLLLIFWMVREHRRDVLHGNYVSKSEVVRATSKPIGVPDLQGSAKPTGPLASAANDLSRIVREVERDDVGFTKDGLTHFSVASESRPAACRGQRFRRMTRWRPSGFSSVVKLKSLHQPRNSNRPLRSTRAKNSW